MPILPFISDSEENIISIVEGAASNGAKYIYPWFGMSLRSGLREYFYSALDKLFPGMKEKYMTTYRGVYECSSPANKRLWKIFCRECQKHKLSYKMPEIIEGAKNLVNPKQLFLF